MEKEMKMRVLEELGGIPEEIYDNLVVELYSLAKGQVEKIREYAESAQWEELARVAHSLKGSAANLRLDSLSETARSLEFFGRDPGDVSEALRLCFELEKHVEELGRELG